MGETNVDGHASMRAQRRMLPFPFLIALLWFTQQQTVGPTPTTTITISAAMSDWESKQSSPSAFFPIAGLFKQHPHCRCS